MAIQYVGGHRFSQGEVFQLIWHGFNHAIVCLSDRSKGIHVQSGYDYADTIKMLMGSTGLPLPEPRKFVGFCNDLKDRSILDKFLKCNADEENGTEKEMRYFALSDMAKQEFWYIAIASLHAFGSIGLSPARFFGNSRDEHTILARPRILTELFDETILDASITEFRQAQKEGFKRRRTYRAEVARNGDLTQNMITLNVEALEDMGLLTLEGEGDVQYRITKDLGSFFNGHILPHQKLKQALHNAYLAGCVKEWDIFTKQQFWEMLIKYWANPEAKTESGLGIDSVRAQLCYLRKKGFVVINNLGRYKAPLHPTENGTRLVTEFFFPLLWHYKRHENVRLPFERCAEMLDNPKEKKNECLTGILKDYITYTSKRVP